MIMMAVEDEDDAEHEDDVAIAGHDEDEHGCDGDDGLCG